MHEWITTLLTAILSSIVPTVILALASRRKTSAEVERIHNDDWRATHAALLQDNNQLRQALSAFDNELFEIRANMAKMCNDYNAELEKLRSDNAQFRAQVACLEDLVKKRDAHIATLESQIASQGVRIAELETENSILKNLLSGKESKNG